MKISAFAATLLIAATAHAAEKKQHVRRTQDGLEKLSEAIEANWGNFDWDKYKPAPAPVCNTLPAGILNAVGEVCTIVPELANQPGTPEGTSVDGVFCTQSGPPQIGPYTLTFAEVPIPITGNSNLLRITLDLGEFEQFDPPNGETTTGPTSRRLSEEEISDRRLALNPLVDPNVNGGSGKPSEIVFQGTWSEDCTFRAVSTQGGMITGNMDNWSHAGHTSVSIHFTQSGQVTSPLSNLRGQFTNVVGLFVSNFAFAFSATFDDHN